MCRLCLKESFLAGKELLLTGGGIKEVELYNPVSKTSCALPALPETRTDHSQDGPLLCGGHANDYFETRQTCMLLNLGIYILFFDKFNSDNILVLSCKFNHLHLFDY